MQLPQAARLGLLIPVAGGQVVQLHRVARVVQAVFQHGPHSAGRALGPQGDGAAALVLEGVHLLFHHVGGIAHAPLEQLGVLKHWGARQSR